MDCLKNGTRNVCFETALNIYVTQKNVCIYNYKTFVHIAGEETTEDILSPFQNRKSRITTTLRFKLEVK